MNKETIYYYYKINLFIIIFYTYSFKIENLI